MGLKCASQTFQRFMHNVLQGVTSVFVYVDDILVFSRSPEEHENTLREVFIRLRENGNTFRPAEGERPSQTCTEFVPKSKCPVSNHLFVLNRAN